MYIGLVMYYDLLVRVNTCLYSLFMYLEEPNYLLLPLES